MDVWWAGILIDVDEKIRVTHVWFAALLDGGNFRLQNNHRNDTTIMRKLYLLLHEI